MSLYFELLLWHRPCSAATTRRYFLPTELSSYEKKDAFPTTHNSALTFVLDRHSFTHFSRFTILLLGSLSWLKFIPYLLVSLLALLIFPLAATSPSDGGFLLDYYGISSSASSPWHHQYADLTTHLDRLDLSLLGGTLRDAIHDRIPSGITS